MADGTEDYTYFDPGAPVADEQGGYTGGTYGDRYYLPVFGKNRTVDFGSGLSGGLSGAGTGAAIGTAFMPGLGTAIGAGVGFLGGGLLGLFGGGEEQDRARQQEVLAAQVRQRQQAALERGYQDQLSALATQRALAEQMNPAEAMYGTQGRPGLLQMQQAQLAQQTAAQGARNRAALASRGLLGSGMEAGSMGALAGQQAAQQAQLQATAAQQYQQQVAQQQQMLGQLGTQQAQLSAQREAARAGLDQAAMQASFAQQQQLAQRNQALIAAGLQGLSTGASAYQQGQALQLAKTQREEDMNLLRQALGITPKPAAAPAAAPATAPEAAPAPVTAVPSPAVVQPVAQPAAQPAVVQPVAQPAAQPAVVQPVAQPAVVPPAAQPAAIIPVPTQPAAQPVAQPAVVPPAAQPSDQPANQPPPAPLGLSGASQIAYNRVVGKMRKPAQDKALLMSRPIMGDSQMTAANSFAPKPAPLSPLRQDVPRVAPLGLLPALGGTYRNG